MQKQDLSQLNLRLPSELKDWVKANAVANHRTATAEAIHILESYKKAKESQNAFSRSI